MHDVVCNGEERENTREELSTELVTFDFPDRPSGTPDTYLKTLQRSRAVPIGIFRLQTFQVARLTVT